MRLTCVSLINISNKFNLNKKKKIPIKQKKKIKKKKKDNKINAIKRSSKRRAHSME